MTAGLSSTLLLTLLLAIGLMFFLRAASKDRTTDVEVFSPLPEVELLSGVTKWLLERGWKQKKADPNRKTLLFTGNVSASPFLAIFLSILGGLGACSLGLVICQLLPQLSWWPLFLTFIGGPSAGFIYKAKASRIESLELRLDLDYKGVGSLLRIRAHRDELIALEIELGETLNLASDGALLTSPI